MGTERTEALVAVYDTKDPSSVGNEILDKVKDVFPGIEVHVVGRDVNAAIAQIQEFGKKLLLVIADDMVDHPSYHYPVQIADLALREGVPNVAIYGPTAGVNGLADTRKAVNARGIQTIFTPLDDSDGLGDWLNSVKESVEEVASIED